MTDTYEEFIKPNPIPQYILDQAYNFNIKWEYVFNDMPLEDKQKRITECLKYSPLGVSVPAWFMGIDDLYYRPQGQQDNHWCVLVKENEDSYEIFDSYDQNLKKVRKDIDFGTCIRYYIEDKPSLWQKILEIFKRIKPLN
jgi:hypothetical protein